MSIGFTYWVDTGESCTTCPPSRFTRGAYSASGSVMIMSSLVVRKALAISRLALKLLPLPGTPKKSPFGFFRRLRSAMIKLLDRALIP